MRSYCTVRPNSQQLTLLARAILRRGQHQATPCIARRAAAEADLHLAHLRPIAMLMNGPPASCTATAPASWTRSAQLITTPCLCSVAITLCAEQCSAIAALERTSLDADTCGCSHSLHRSTLPKHAAFVLGVI